MKKNIEKVNFENFVNKNYRLHKFSTIISIQSNASFKTVDLSLGFHSFNLLFNIPSYLISLDEWLCYIILI